MRFIKKFESIENSYNEIGSAEFTDNINREWFPFTKYQRDYLNDNFINGTSVFYSPHIKDNCNIAANTVKTKFYDKKHLFTH